MSDLFAIEAVVQVGACETRYLRCGRGPRCTIVLARTEPERLELLREHSGSGTVIAPVPQMWPEDDAAAARLGDWLRGVADGLGLDAPGIVTSAELGWLRQYLE